MKKGNLVKVYTNAVLMGILNKADDTDLILSGAKSLHCDEWPYDGDGANKVATKSVTSIKVVGQNAPADMEYNFTRTPMDWNNNFGF